MEDDEDYNLSDFFEFDHDINEDFGRRMMESIEQLGASSLREFGMVKETPTMGIVMS